MVFQILFSQDLIKLHAAPTPKWIPSPMGSVFIISPDSSTFSLDDCPVPVEASNLPVSLPLALCYYVESLKLVSPQLRCNLTQQRRFVMEILGCHFPVWTVSMASHLTECVTWWLPSLAPVYLPTITFCLSIAVSAIVLSPTPLSPENTSFCLWALAHAVPRAWWAQHVSPQTPTYSRPPKSSSARFRSSSSRVAPVCVVPLCASDTTLKHNQPPVRLLGSHCCRCIQNLRLVTDTW